VAPAIVGAGGLRRMVRGLALPACQCDKSGRGWKFLAGLRQILFRYAEQSTLARWPKCRYAAVSAIGADGGTRTRTGFPPRDFKSLASTISPRPPRADNYTTSAPATTREAGDHPTAPCRPNRARRDILARPPNARPAQQIDAQLAVQHCFSQVRLDYCACCAGGFFFCADAFWVDVDAFGPVPAGACRTSAQGSAFFCAGILLVAAL
jgi:hypothetical protein